MSNASESDPERRRQRACAAALAVAADLGVDAQTATILQDWNNTIIRLEPPPIVAKVGTSHFRDARLESLAGSASTGDLDENDPGSVARFMKKMGQEFGDDLGDDFGSAVDEAMAEGEAAGGGEEAGGSDDAESVDTAGASDL